jgi:FixJ family two-component response regulator
LVTTPFFSGRLLFTDIQMPGADDGLELAQKVHQRWPRVLLLVTSGGIRVPDEDLPDDGKFLAKPYQDQEMIDHVEGQIARGHTAQNAKAEPQSDG